MSFVIGKKPFEDENKIRSYGIASSINCNSSNFVYLNTCKGYGLQYVGSTSTKFRLRLNNYRAGYNKFIKGRRDIPQAGFVYAERS